MFDFIESAPTMKLDGGIYTYSLEHRRHITDEPPYGRKVVYLNDNGHDLDREQANQYLKEGQILTVKEIYVGRSSSKVEFVELPNQIFNTVMFADLEPVVANNDMELGNLIFGNSRGEYPVNREWQDMFCEYLFEMGFSVYGTLNSENSPLSEFERVIITDTGGKHYKYENDVFIIMPYYWGEDEEIEALPNFVYKPEEFTLSWYKYALRDSYMNKDITYQQLEDYLIKCKESIKEETYWVFDGR